MPPTHDPTDNSTQDTSRNESIDTPPPVGASIVEDEVQKTAPKTKKPSKNTQKKVKNEQPPATPVDPQLFAQCKRFVDIIEERLKDIFKNPHLVPDSMLSIPPAGAQYTIEKEYFYELEQHWLRLCVDGTIADVLLPSSSTPRALNPQSGDDRDNNGGSPPRSPTLIAKLSLTDTPKQHTTHHILQFNADSNAVDQEPTVLPSQFHEELQAEGEVSSILVIPVHLLPKASDLDPTINDPLYRRLIRSLIFTFQHPRGILGPDGKFDPELSLQRFEEAIAADRSGEGEQGPLFKTLCIVWTDRMDVIPVFYGHSAWRRLHPEGQPRTPTDEELEQQRAYRQSAMGRNPLTTDEMKKQEGCSHPVEQCAENLALPFALRAATRYLAEGKADTVTIFSSAYSLKNDGTGSNPAAFCSNCVSRVQILVANATGVRIVDKVDNENGTTQGTTYESFETKELFNAIQNPAVHSPTVKLPAT